MTTATKQGHTPGKWRIGDAGKSVFGPPSDQPAPVLICSVPGMSSRVSLAERQANARLIAAAPELLEALQSILFQAGCREARDLGNLNYDRLHAVEAQARAAIARATGQGEARP